MKLKTVYSHFFRLQRRTFARGAFATIDTVDVQAFTHICGSAGVVSSQEDLESFNSDWMRQYKGNASVALKPASTAEVGSILKYCFEKNIAVTPQGGNTGLVGGSVPVFDEIVLSTSRMNNIISFDELSGVLVCEAGCILENLENYLKPKGFTMPLDLGAKGSCQIGGNVATNAGGVRYVRFGSLHGSVLGIEAVLPNGEVLDALSSLKKDNTGYDLKQLFIGSEGTLGVITKVALAVPRVAPSSKVLLLALDSFDSVLKTLKMVRSELFDILNAVEFFDKESFDLVLEHSSDLHNPLSEVYPFYMLVEVSERKEDSETERLTELIEKAVEAEFVVDGTLASGKSQEYQLWRLREACPEAVSRAGWAYKYDVSLPVGEMYELVEVMRDRLPLSRKQVVGYGHLGDGNLHLNIWTPEREEQRELKKSIEPFVFEEVARRKGSISAEHGLGLMKAKYMPLTKSATNIQIMKSIKKVFDPKGIMNPYKFLPE